MKHLFYISILALVFSSCGEKQSGEKSSADSSSQSVNESLPAENVSNKAVLLWDAGIISAPSAKDGKWVATYQFGNTLELTGKSEENTTEKRTYIEVRGPDGKTGWISEALVIANAHVCVAIEDVTFYKNADIMSVSTEKIKQLDIVAVSAEDHNGFHQIFGKEKKIKGYINSMDKFSTIPADMQIALLFQRAMNQKTQEEQIKALLEIKSDEANAGSRFYEVVVQKFNELSGISDQSMSDGESDNINGFLKKFEQYVIDHNSAQVLNCMDPEYKRRQHDDFLEGRTSQFLNEFFCGTDSDGNFKCIKFSDITYIQNTSADQRADGYSYTVTYIIRTADANIECSWKLIETNEGEGVKSYGFWGAEG